MLDGDGPLERFELRRVRRAAGPDLHILQRRQILRHRIIQIQPPLLDQHQHRDARDDLRHRIHAADRIALHRQLPLHVAITVGLEIHDLPITRQQRDEPGMLTFVHEPLGRRVQHREPRRIKPCRLGRSRRQLRPR